MKINIVVNTFQNYHRQNIAVDSWRYLKQIYPDQIDIWNIQFADEENDFINPYPDIPVKFVLSDSRKVIDGATKKLPFTNELYNAALEIEGDYFIITNSDVIIMPILIEYIKQKLPKAHASSRLDIQNIQSFNQIINQDIIPVRYEIAGFDTFCFDKKWAEENKELFQNEFVLGKSLWDVVWAGYIKIYGGNEPLGNGFPPFCFHIHHGIDSVTTECPEKDWNVAVTKSLHMNIMVCNAMVWNLTQNLMRRTPQGAFMQQRENERLLERVFFDSMRIDRNLT